MQSKHLACAAFLLGGAILIGCGSSPDEKSAQVDESPLCTQPQGLHMQSLCNPGGWNPPPPRPPPPPPPSPPSIFSSTYSGAICGGADQLLAGNLSIPPELAGKGCSGGIEIYIQGAWFPSYFWACPANAWVDPYVPPIGFTGYPEQIVRPATDFCDNVVGLPSPGMLFLIAYKSGDSIGGGCRGAACM